MSMQRIVLFFLVLFGVMACKTSKDDIDPRAPYIGQYDVDYTAVTKIGSFTYGTDTGKGKITISQGAQADELIFDIVFPAYNEKVTGFLNGKEFRLNKVKEPLVIGARTYSDADYAARGEFTSGGFTMLAVTQTVQDNTTLMKTGTFTAVRK